MSDTVVNLRNERTGYFGPSTWAEALALIHELAPVCWDRDLGHLVLTSELIEICVHPALYYTVNDKSFITYGGVRMVPEKLHWDQIASFIIKAETGEGHWNFLDCPKVKAYE